ncbi:MAG: phosphogluconate dehydrogenase (NAD(+)-dependent, decarboxylating) [Acidimicrobiia bacterium]
MEIGMVGLGRMGASMGERLVRGGHRVMGYDLSGEAVRVAEKGGVEGAGSLAELAGALDTPRVVWMMVPAGLAVEATLEALLPLLDRGDIVVDGGNSWYRDTIRRAELCAGAGVDLVDCGTSGGVWGLSEGYCLMVGGGEEAVAALHPILETLAPSPGAGWGRVGPPGAGHFVKMIHNGIEYGLMEAYAEGFAILDAKSELGLDLHQVAEIWRHGSVVRSWLLDLAAEALADPEALMEIAPWVPDSGEGRWTVFEAIELNVPADVIASSLFRRIESRDRQEFADRLLAALRQGFGGHAVKMREG